MVPYGKTVGDHSKATIYCPFCGKDKVWKNDNRTGYGIVEYLCVGCCCVFQLTYGMREMSKEDVNAVINIIEETSNRD